MARLPDPVVALGAAFREGRAIKVSILERRVLATDYPEGYFGHWIHEGILVSDRVEITDGPEARLVFALLAETVGEIDEEEYFWFEEAVAGMSAADYRRATGFVPDLVVDFAGAPRVRVEINLSLRRALIEVGHDWEVFVTDRWAADALLEFVGTKAVKTETAQ